MRLRRTRRSTEDRSTLEGKMDKLLLRVSEAAEMASLGRSKAYEMVATGAWPSVMIGRAVRIPVDGLLAWIEEQKRLAEQDRETA